MDRWIAATSTLWFVTADGFLGVLVFASYFSTWRRWIVTRLLPLSVFRSSIFPPISIIVPAYNEELTIVESVRALMRLDYPRYEVVVVNDGSPDDTLGALCQAFSLKPIYRLAIKLDIPTEEIKSVYHNPDFSNFYVIDKINGGKGGALNAGINFSQYPWVCTIDADSLLDRRALLHLMRTYAQQPQKIVALGGMIRVANGCTVEQGRVAKDRLPRNMLATMQMLEYIKTFIGGRIGWTVLGGLPIVSGAFGLFRRDLVVAIGGYSRQRPGEDMEIVMRLHEYCLDHSIPYAIVFCPDAVCWTQVPETRKILAHQRRRWGRGNLRNIQLFLHMFGRPRYRVVGLVTLPYLVTMEFLSPYLILLTTLLTLILVLHGHTVPPFLWFIALIGWVIDFTLGILSIILDDIAYHHYRWSDMLKLFLNLVHMPLWYYPMVTYWRIAGHIQLLRKINPWGDMTRKSWGSSKP